MISIIAFVKTLARSGINATNNMRALSPLRLLADGPDFAIDVVSAHEVLGAGQDSALLDRDIVLLSRRYGLKEAQGQVVEEAHRLGAVVIFDTDDDLSGQQRNSRHGGDFIEAVSLADYVTVSTQHLGQELAKFTRSRPVVLPNCLDVRWFSRASLRAERVFAPELVTIGLIGSDTHTGDWDSAAEAIQRLLDKYPNVLAVTATDVIPWSVQGLSRLATIKPVPYYAYPELVRQIDIVCCCLDDRDPFNCSKSSVKALESMAAARQLSNGRIGGAVAVCTNMLPYQGVINGRNGLLINNDQWYDALEELVQDAARRNQMAADGLEWVTEHRNIEREFYRWGRLYKEILGGSIVLEGVGR